jgi:triosephosphate isomerase
MNKPRYIIANWKMNPQKKEDAEILVKNILNNVKIKNDNQIKIVFLPPFVWIETIGKLIKNSGKSYSLGAQNIFWEKSGAYTGEISLEMISSIGCRYVLIGHSERKLFFHESAHEILSKLKLAVDFGLIPIVCLDPECIDFEEFSRNLLDDVPENNRHNIIFVYEPMKAISTQKGEIPSKEIMVKMKTLIKETFWQQATVLYGGSVNSGNIGEFINKIGFDGALVGAKSLDSKEFSLMISQLSQ